MNEDQPIGIFDSGVGGLTVFREISELLPQEHLIYFGDTARFPYGPRSHDEVRKFAFEIMELLLSMDVKMLVIACNTMSAVAIDEAKERFDVPVIGVIEPAVRAAVRSTRNRKVGVLGTQATITSGAYERSIAEVDADIEVLAAICSGFVERVEEGDNYSEELFALAENYLGPLMASGADSLILGCTHYPMLRGVLHSVTRGETALISSADEVAKEAYSALVDREILRRSRTTGTRSFLVSGDPNRFRDIGSRFLAGLDEVNARPWPPEAKPAGA